MLDSKKEAIMASKKRVEDRVVVTTPSGKVIIKQGVFESPLGDDSDDRQRWTFIQGTITVKKGAIIEKILTCQFDDVAQCFRGTFLWYEPCAPDGSCLENTLEGDVAYGLKDDGDVFLPVNIEQANLTTYIVLRSGVRLLRSVAQGSFVNLLLEGFGVWKQYFYFSDLESAQLLGEQEEIGFFEQNSPTLHGRMDVVDKTSGDEKQVIGFFIVEDSFKVVHGPNCRSILTRADGSIREEIGKFDKGNLIQGTSLQRSSDRHEYLKIDRTKKKEYKLLKENNTISLFDLFDNEDEIKIVARIINQQLFAVTFRRGLKAYSVYRDSATGLFFLEEGESTSRRSLSAKDEHFVPIFLQTESRLLKVDFIQPSKFTVKSFFDNNKLPSVLLRPVPPRERKMGEVTMTLSTGETITKAGLFEAPPGKVPADLKEWNLIDGESTYPGDNCTIVITGIYDHYRRTFRGAVKSRSTFPNFIEEERLTSKTEFQLLKDGRIVIPLQLEDVTVEIYRILSDQRSYLMRRGTVALLHDGKFEGNGEGVNYTYNPEWEKIEEKCFCGTFLDDYLIVGSLKKTSPNFSIVMEGTFIQTLPDVIELHGPNCTYSETYPTWSICQKGAFQMGKMIQGRIVSNENNKPAHGYVDLVHKELTPHNVLHYHDVDQLFLKFYQEPVPIILKISLNSERRLTLIERYHAIDDADAHKPPLWQVRRTGIDQYVFDNLQKQIIEVTNKQGINYFKMVETILSHYKLTQEMPSASDAMAAALLLEEENERQKKSKKSAATKAEKRHDRLAQKHLKDEQAKRAAAAEILRQQQLTAAKEAENEARRQRRKALRELDDQTKQAITETRKIEREQRELQQSSPAAAEKQQAKPAAVVEATMQQQASPSAIAQTVSEYPGGLFSPQNKGRIIEPPQCIDPTLVEPQEVSAESESPERSSPSSSEAQQSRTIVYYDGVFGRCPALEGMGYKFIDRLERELIIPLRASLRSTAEDSPDPASCSLGMYTLH